MLENENLVTQEGTENAEHTAEQTPAKTYTEEEVNQIVGKKLARNSAKIRKEYEKKYGDLETVLVAGTGETDIGKMTDTFRKFYQSKGLDIPNKVEYSSRDIEKLARADAEDIISGGFDEVIEEADRLKDLGVENMTAREKAVFQMLAEHIKTTETSNELAKIGVTEEVYNSQEFKDFKSNFNPNVPIAKIFEIYNSTKPKKEIKTMGSMKNSGSTEGAVKDFYTFEEASKFTKKDFDKNPALYKAVEASMLKWK